MELKPNYNSISKTPQSVYDVYEKYCHLDYLLCDLEWLPNDITGHIFYDIWQAVRAAALESD